MRLAVYGTTSVALGLGVIVSAFNHRANFYSACVHLGQSNACLMVLTNFLLLLSILLGHALQLIFYGPLRTPEIERLYEKAWYAVTETCLAMTIFRDEFDVRFIVMFGVLLFIKCFCWVGGGRVEFMETQPPANPTLFHIRLASSLILLLCACSTMLWHSVVAVLGMGRPNLMVMFAFEFAILLITSLAITGRYVLNMVEKVILKREANRRRAARISEIAATRQRRTEQRAQNAQRRAQGEVIDDGPEPEDEDEEDELDVGGWEEKGAWVFYLELTTDLLKLLTYLSFFSIVLTWYGLPLHIIRDVYLTLRSFITRIRDFIRYRRATAHMNSRYPDASAEEVEREAVCIICREEMRAWTEGEGGRAADTQDQRHRPKRLPCGHVLHFACLRSWLERQQRCPTCRRPVLDEPNANTGARNNNPVNPGAEVQPGVGFAVGNGGVGFGAQLGPLGFGVGGPGFVQNLMERMNPQLQQLRQGQFPPVQAENLARVLAGAPNNTQAEIEQHIARTRQLLDRELAMVDLTQRQLRQLQELRAQVQVAADGTQAALNVTGHQAAPAAAPNAAAPSANIPAIDPRDPLPFTTSNNDGQGPHNSGGMAGSRWETRDPGSPANNGGSSTSTTAPANPLPPGMAIPPGWSVIPLAIPRAGEASGARGVGSAGQDVEFLPDGREQRTQQEWMAAYPTRMTPGAAPAREGAEPGSAWPGASRDASQSKVPRVPSVPWDVTTRLSTAQTARLRPAAQHSIAIISSFVQHHLDEDEERHALEILLGLPKELRQEVLQGWPDQEMADVLAAGTQGLVGSQEARESLAATRVGITGLFLPFEGRIRLVFGLSKSSFRTTVLEVLQDDRVNSELERLENAIDDMDETTSNVPNLLESISDWTEVPCLEEGSSPEETDRIERQTREIANRRIRVLNDLSRAMRNAASRLEQVDEPSASSRQISSRFNDDHELSLFGNRSVFDRNSQQGALSALVKEIIDAEREWRDKARAVSGLLGSEPIGESSQRKGKGKQTARAVTVEDADE